MVPNGDSQDGFFYPTLVLMMDSYFTKCFFPQKKQRRKKATRIKSHQKPVPRKKRRKKRAPARSGSREITPAEAGTQKTKVETLIKANQMSVTGRDLIGKETIVIGMLKSVLQL